jgi:hypothetical protein
MIDIWGGGKKYLQNFSRNVSTWKEEAAWESYA